MTEIYEKSGGGKGTEEEWQGKVAAIVLREWDLGQTFASDMNDLYEDLYQMLRGGRPKKDYDWQSNFSLRKAFPAVWTLISYVTQKIYGASPVIGISGWDRKGAVQRERLIQTWMERDRYFLILVMGLLRLALNGTVIFKKMWRQTTVSKTMQKEMPIPVWDEEGRLSYVKDTRNIEMTFPIEDRPEDLVLNNKDVVVDWLLKPGQSVREGRFIIHREVLDLASLYSSRIKYMNLDDVPRETAGGTTEAQDHSRLRQEDSQGDIPTSELYCETEIFEREGIWPVKISKKGKITPIFDKEEIYQDDTEWRHMIATVASKSQPVLIRWEENPYGEFNYFDAHMYFDPERWQSVGTIEPVKDIYAAQDDNLNAMFEGIWKGLMPPVIVNQYGVHDWDSIKYAPNQVWKSVGNPSDNFLFPRMTDIPADAWNKHAMLESEGQLITSVTPGVSGMGKEKTATMGVLNTQYSTGKLDFIVWMLSYTWLIPSAQMSLRFAQKFAHPLTFLTILGEAFKFDRFMNEYKFIPAAPSVKLPEQAEVDVQQDIQLMQIIQAYNNPNTPKIMNYLLSDILRLRNMPQLSQLFDEGYFEPSGEAGNMQMIEKMLTGGGGGGPSNEQGIPMSAKEQSMRQQTNEPRGLIQ